MRRLALLIGLILYACAPAPFSTNNTATPTSRPDGCDHATVTSYLDEVDTAMTKLDQLGRQFGKTQTRDDAKLILDQTETLFNDVFLWKYPDCAEQVHVNLLLAIENLAAAMRAVLDNDPQEAQRNYATYAIAVQQLNAEVEKLLESVGEN